jgi:alpha-amylase
MHRITMLQFFHWYYPDDGSLYKFLENEAPSLQQKGINAEWLPPAYKGSRGAHSEGYDTYDLFDLGEFDQKGSVRTKYGTKEEYLNAIRKCHEHGIQVIADVVFNHKHGGDELETITVRKVNPDNRKEFISEPFEIEAWTKFTFPGRAGKYSDFIWDHRCFTGVDHAHNLDEDGIYTIQNEYGEGWEDLIEEELGNYDFLMGADVEFRNPAVREELKHWGTWCLQTTDVDGFRLDAIKHMTPAIVDEWVTHVQHVSDKHLFVVAEYWNYNTDALLQYLDVTGGKVQLFDAALHHNFHVAGKQGKDYDLTSIFENSLVKAAPTLAVTLVDNHDTQPLQSLESPVEQWFKPLAYAMILLREHGTPCIFFPALYGAHYRDRGRDGNEHEIWLAKVEELDLLLPLRSRAAHGEQRDYLDHPNCIGWTRLGVNEIPGSGLAVLLSNGSEGFKYMEMGEPHAGKKMVDALKKCDHSITLNDKGGADFNCPAGAVSVWIFEELAQNF